MTKDLDLLTKDELLKLFGDWIILDSADGYVSPHTKRAYLADMGQFVDWMGRSEVSFSELTEDHLRLYRGEMASKYAAGTSQRKLVAIRRFTNSANRRGYIPTDPARYVKPPRERTDRAERIKFLTLEELTNVLSLPMQTHKDTPRGLRDRLVLTLMAVHGLRVSEVVALNVKDYSRNSYSFGALNVTGKGHKDRTIILTEKSAEVLDEWLGSRALLNPPDDAVVTTLHWGLRVGEKQYHRISCRSVREMVDQYLVAANAKREGISCHSLRHSFAAHSLSRGARLVDISGALGHVKISTTMIYAKVIDKEKHNPARLMENLL